MKKLLALFLVLMASCSMAPAQTLKVATGGAAGTYSRMLKEVTSICQTDIAIQEVNTSGSVENVTNLVGNQVNAAFVQSDVLWLRAQTEDLSNVKTLVSLHPEAVHVVALAQSGLKQGGVMGVGGSEVVFSDVSQLAGRRVGAAGGSFITAKVIQLQGEIPYTVVPFDTNEKAISALQERQVEAVVLVGGAPLGTVDKLGPQFKLLGFNQPTIDKLKAYRSTRLSYAKLGAAGLTSVATDALFVTREYKTQKMVQGLASLRSCITNGIDELKETTGTHPSWQHVDPANRGKWAYYELPVASAVTTSKKK